MEDAKTSNSWSVWPWLGSIGCRSGHEFILFPWGFDQRIWSRGCSIWSTTWPRPELPIGHQGGHRPKWRDAKLILNTCSWWSLFEDLKMEMINEGVGQDKTAKQSDTETDGSASWDNRMYEIIYFYENRCCISLNDLAQGSREKTWEDTGHVHTGRRGRGRARSADIGWTPTWPVDPSYQSHRCDFLYATSCCFLHQASTRTYP